MIDPASTSDDNTMSGNRSLLTNRTSPDLECCYLLPGGDRRDEYMAKFFTALGFSGEKEFTFEGPEHRIFLEAGLRERWETYGIFCFVPPLDILEKWMKFLKAKNAEWKADSRRPAEVYETMLTDLKTHGLRVLVLHPMHFLPKGKRIQVVRPNNSIRKYSISSDNRSCLVDKSGRELCIKVSRDISPFALIVNAFSKLDCLSEDELYQDGFGGSYMRMQKSALLELIDLVYWAPSGHEAYKFDPKNQPVDTKGKRRAQDMDTDSDSDSGPDPEPPMKKRNVDDSDDSDGDSSSDSSEGGSHSELSPDELLPNGLTQRQHDMVGERLFDESLPADERINNVMMWIGMGRAPEEVPDFMKAPDFLQGGTRRW
ncbi:hypothetical protein VNI00_014190 [Paramarasmius palmivorus]|uniref:Uncharacterized protein n=2 Tax=Paramarasmius palmivorus TaxID=297713 RepID=A0AAW0BW88_9AGAR